MPLLTRVRRMVKSLCLEELAHRREPQRAPDSVERPRDVDGGDVLNVGRRYDNIGKIVSSGIPMSRA